MPIGTLVREISRGLVPQPLYLEKKKLFYYNSGQLKKKKKELTDVSSIKLAIY